MSFFNTIAAASFRVKGEEVPVSPYEQETMDFMNATTTPDDSAPSIYTGLTNHDCWELLDSVVKYYKNEGVWADIYHWHPMFGGTASKHAFNARNINVFPMQFFGSWQYSAMGNQGNGHNTYVNFGFIPSAHMTFENVGLTIVSNTDSSTNTTLEIGSSSGTNNRTYIQIRSADNTYARIGSTGAGVVANNDARGIFSGSRSNGQVLTYKNSVQTSTGSGKGNGLSAVTSYYGAYNNEGVISLYSDRRLASAMHHKATDIIKIHTGLLMWEEGLGRKTW